MKGKKSMFKIKKTIEIPNEMILLRFLENLLSKGVTTPITEEMFFSVREKWIETIEKDPTMLASKQKIKFLEEDFFDIIEKANNVGKCNQEKNIRINTEINEEKKGVAIPTYSLKKTDLDAWKGKFGREIYLLDSILNEKVSSIPLCEFSLKNVPEDILIKAEKVSAFYINDLIQRYIKYKISYGKWPNQCEDIDEYVFKRNIASFIDEKGTKEIFKLAYLNAIKVVCQEILSKENSPLFFSNNDQNLLAHANFLKFVLPEPLQFLKIFKHNPLEAYNASIDLQVLKQAIYYDTIYDRFSPYQGNSHLVRKNGIVDKDTVKIMKKRIGKIR